MSDLATHFRTPLPSEEVVVRAVQFFSGTEWRPSGQSNRTATFQGMPPIPWALMLLTVAGFIFCVVPGVVCYFLLIKRLRRFENLVITAYPIAGGTEVQITYPTFATDVVSRFTRSLPPLESPSPLEITSPLEAPSPNVEPTTLEGPDEANS